MKKILLIVVVFLSITSANAQKSKVTGAQNYLTSGKLDKAKLAIDEGIKHEKCVNYPKAYLVKGKVYQGIFESPLPAYKELEKNPLDVAYAAYLMALELDEKGKMTKPVKAQMTDMIPDYTNEAVNRYNNGDIKANIVSKHHKEINEIMDAKKYNEALKVVYSEYESVIPYFEKALETQPNENNSLIALKEIYFKLRNEKPEFMAKYNEIKTKLDGLE